MRKRILRVTMLVLLVALATALPMCAWLMARNVTYSVDRNMSTVAHVLAAVLEPGEATQAMVERLSEEAGGLRITVISADGKVLADSSSLYYPQYNYLQWEEIQEAAAHGEGSATRKSENFGRMMNYSAVKMADGGYVRVSREYSGFFQELAALLPPVCIAILLAFLVAVPLTRRLSRSIVEPLNRFSEGLDAVMDGNVTLDPEATPYGELQRMAVKINCLSKEVGEGILRVEREHKRIETILANMHEGFAMSDAADELILINEAACRILGCAYPPEGTSLLHATRNMALLEAVADVKKFGGTRRMELSAPTGEIYEASLTSVSSQDMRGTVRSAVVMLLTDVTDKRQASEMRQDFFRNASHELKTPITSIRGFAELLCATPMDEERRQEFIERILKESQRMDSLIEDILMINRLESGDIAFERTPLDFYEVVRECCDDARPLALESNIDIFFDGVHCTFLASHREMSELAGNLVSNAVKYNRPDGYIEVKLRRVGGTVVFTVFNTGEAIPAAETKLIFERFYRMDKGRSKAMGGTGLGLSIVRHVASQYGAEVSVIPKRGIGNIFKVVFPRVEEGMPGLQP